MTGNKRIEFWGNITGPSREDLKEILIKYEQRIDIILSVILPDTLIETYKLHKCKVSYRDIASIIKVSHEEARRRYRQAIRIIKKFKLWLNTIG